MSTKVALGSLPVTFRFRSRSRLLGILLLLPLALVTAFFFVYPMLFLLWRGLHTAEGLSLRHYLAILSDARYRQSLVNSVTLSAVVTVASMVLSTTLAFFFARYDFPGKRLFKALLTFPLSFPGVVVGFMIIILFGRTGVIPMVAMRIVGRPLFNIAYTLAGLFVAYLYFEIPRVTLTMIASVQKMDRRLEEASRSLGAAGFQTLIYVTLPAIWPALISASALAFATSMGAFGTAFTLAQNFNILPMLIYTEYTMSFNIEMASAMAVFLGAITLALLAVYRSWGQGRGRSSA
ncbi:MAG: ABC transporter permease [Bacillota bacterium]|nr:ABC transporter permease [Bacillota bacterium]